LNTIWKNNVLNPLSLTGVDDITDTVNSIFDTISESGYKAVDLRGIEFYNVNYEHLVAILRATSSFKESIPGWYEALHFVKKTLDQKNTSTQDILYGLI
jgi:hypothetical protein